jgi:hypothetical protein
MFGLFDITIYVHHKIFERKYSRQKGNFTNCHLNLTNVRFIKKLPNKRTGDHCLVSAPGYAVNLTVIRAVVDAVFRPQTTVLNTDRTSGMTWRLRYDLRVSGPSSSVVATMPMAAVQN